MKRPENKRNQAKDVKVYGARSVPPADENEQADEKIKQTHDSQIVFGCEGLFRRRREERRLEFLTAAGKLVVQLRPKPSTVWPPGDLRGCCDSGAIYARQ